MTERGNAASRFGVGVIGCGFIAEVGHLPAIRAIPGLTIVAASDPQEFRRIQYARVAGIQATDMYDDHRRLLERRDVDLAIVSVPPNAHCDVVVAAIRAGKHVICEKPIAIDLAEADQMLDAAERAGVQFGVFNNYLFFPENRIAGEALRGGAIGAVRLVHIEAFGLGMDMPRVQALYRGATVQWKEDPAIGGGGVFMDYGIHAAYLAEFYFGSRAQTVNAVMGRFSRADLQVEDYVMCRLEFPTGYALIELSWHPAMPSPARVFQRGGVRILGESGAVDFAYAGHGEAPHSPVEKVCVRTAAEETVHLVEAADASSKRTDAFRRALEDFVQGVIEQRRPLTSAKTARRSLELVLAGYASAARGSTVDVPFRESRQGGSV